MASNPARGPAVAVVTINWNNAGDTLRCLAALRAGEGPAWHLFIVDNASADGSADRLSGLGDDVTLIRSAVNGGWTGGNNRGIRAALAAGHDLVLILNNDAFVRPDTLARLVEAFGRRPDLPILGPVHRSAGTGSYDFSLAHRDPKTGIPAWTPPEGLGPETRHDLYRTAYVSGAGILAHRRHFETVGLLDDRFFLNFDDTDWCARAEAEGFPLLMVRDATIDHVGSASIGGRHSPLQTYFLTRNRLLYAEKHVSALARLRLVRRYVWQARDLAGGGLIRLLRARDPVCAAFRRGLLDYCLRRFGDCPPVVRRWQQAFAAAAAPGG